MTPAGRRALWIAAVFLLLAVVGGGGNEVEGGFTAAGDDLSLELRIDLNRAGIAELESLPGIGPALAARIEGHRRREGPFLRIDDLGAVAGIGAVTIRALAPFLTVGEEGAVSATGE
jgi:hypothetical protein